MGNQSTGWLFKLAPLLLVYTMQSHAADQNSFTDGMNSFKSGDYRAAVEAFEQTRQQKKISAALYYNLASSYYKLGNYEKAQHYFRLVSKYPKMKSLAEYNLGLIALKQGDSKAADTWFKSVINISSDSKLVALARRQLGRIRFRPEFKKWTSFLRGGLGYDDNINIAPIDTALEQSDSFYDLFASVDYKLKGSRRDGWMAGASFYSINYFDSSNYDEAQYGAGLKKIDTFGLWSTRLSARLDKLTYAGDDYQTIVGVRASAKRRLSRMERLQLRYRYEDIGSDNVLYDYLDGWRQQVRAEYRYYGKADNKRLYYELELNDRQDTVNASYSPIRHTIRAVYTQKLDKKTRWSGDIAYRSSAYDYPTTSPLNRDDTRWRAGAQMDYRLSKTLKFQGQLVHTSNDSSLPQFDYTRNVFRLNLSKLL
jgi:tetratricopeptide (TPR) repeat protein